MTPGPLPVAQRGAEPGDERLEGVGSVGRAGVVIAPEPSISKYAGHAPGVQGKQGEQRTDPRPPTQRPAGVIRAPSASQAARSASVLRRPRFARVLVPLTITAQSRTLHPPCPTEIYLN